MLTVRYGNLSTRICWAELTILLNRSNLHWELGGLMDEIHVTGPNRTFTLGLYL